MGFQFKFFHKHSSSSHHKSSSHKDEDSSKEHSLDEDVHTFAFLKKYLADPMRFNDHPDYVGSFVDPMGARSTFSTSYDITNTGA